MICVSSTTAGAVKLSPAILAFGSCVCVAGAEFILYGGIGYTVPDIAEAVFGITDELMAGEKLTPRRYRHIFRAGAATRDALVDAGTVFEVEHIMIEREASAFLFAAEHFLCEDLVLLEKLGEIFLGECVGIVGRTYDGLHAEFGEAEVSHVEQVVGKVHSVVCERTANVVILAAALFNETLEIGHDGIVAALARVVFAEMVVDFLASVKAEHDVVHFLIQEVDDFIVDQNAVGREGEAEVLVVLLFNASCVSNELLDDVPVHEGLAAEEVNLKVSSRARIFDQKIESLFTDFKAHQRAFALIFALAGKAVGAVQIAGVRNVETERLDDLAVIFIIVCEAFKLILRGRENTGNGS